MPFIKNTTYYRGEVYEWNLPAGHSCPYAKDCRINVEIQSGKFKVNKEGSFKCYAAIAERFPDVRELWWQNFSFIKSGFIPEIPEGCKAVRIHASGDFFSQEYFDMWLEICRKHPKVEFWAFTKSLIFWINRLNVIPSNLILTASYGGKLDKWISVYNLKSARVIKSTDKTHLLIDTNDDLARLPNISFALLDNHERR